MNFAGVVVLLYLNLESGLGIDLARSRLLDVVPSVDDHRNLSKQSVFMDLLGGSPTIYNVRTPKITDWGTWGVMELCPAGSFVKGVSVAYEPSQGGDADDSALNTVKFYCGFLGEGAIQATQRMISSTQGPFGVMSTGIQWCPSGGFVVGLEARVEAVGHDDDTAMNQIRVKCSTSSGPSPVLGGTSWGDWGGKTYCPPGTIVQGLRTQMEPNLGGGRDDSALNNIEMQCGLPAVPKCQPKDSWVFVSSCENDNNEDAQYTYTHTVGMSLEQISYSGGSISTSWSSTVGASLSAGFLGIFSSKISTSLSQSATTNYNWKDTQSSWSTESTTVTAVTTVPAKKTVIIYQVKATCGSTLTVGAPKYRLTEVNTKSFRHIQGLGEDALRDFAFSHPEQ